jgi:hypothetical protein
MALYQVSWHIAIDAQSHREAADKALEIQRNPDSIATVFNVRNEDDAGPEKTIDLATYWEE